MSASENPGTTQTYAYDLAGNRTGVWINGTQTQSLSYNAANQVDGWSYDAVGNLLSDGTQSSSYDALNRVLTVGSSSNAYNGDGVLVQQHTTAYTQDLAAPLSQILSDGTNRFVYGTPAERLFGEANSAKTWYLTDALGSIRATLDDAGMPIAAANYDAWGVPETPLIAPFGFTGEVQQGSDVWLRARWYGAGRGGFGSRDPYAGDVETPYSLLYYQYGYSNPVSNRDPSGQWVPDDRRPPPTQYGPCAPGERYVASMGGCIVPTPSTNPMAPQGPLYACATFLDHAANSLWDLGLVIGASASVTGLAFQGVVSIEQVFDLYTFEYGVFHSGGGGNSFFELVGGGVHSYYGFQWGWSNYQDKPTIENYAGLAKSYGGGVEVGKIGVSITYSSSATEGLQQPYTTPPNMLLQSISIGGDYGAALALPISASAITMRATLISGTGTGQRFRTGKRGLPTSADAKRFETFVREAILDPILELYAIQVVEHNALFWDANQ